MEKGHKVHRWRPLLIGACSVLILSAVITLDEKSHFDWGTRTFVRMWLLTASGIFADLRSSTNLMEEGIGVCVAGMLNLLALFSYCIRPSKVTKVITVMGFIVWQFYGFLIPRMGV